MLQQDTTGLGAWYTHPAWTALGIVSLVVIVLLIRLASRRTGPPRPPAE